MAPTSLSHIIGQKSVVAQVAVALEAAFADNKKFDSALMVGPPRVGKSALAHVVAEEMTAQLHEVLSFATNCHFVSDFGRFTLETARPAT